MPMFLTHFDWSAHARPQRKGLGKVHGECAAVALPILELDRVQRYIFDVQVFGVLRARLPVAPFQQTEAVYSQPVAVQFLCV